jgi:hypothetical protein
VRNLTISLHAGVARWVRRYRNREKCGVWSAFYSL